MTRSSQSTLLVLTVKNKSELGFLLLSIELANRFRLGALQSVFASVLTFKSDVSSRHLNTEFTTLWAFEPNISFGKAAKPPSLSAVSEERECSLKNGTTLLTGKFLRRAKKTCTPSACTVTKHVRLQKHNVQSQPQGLAWLLSKQEWAVPEVTSEVPLQTWDPSLTPVALLPD